MRTLIFIGFFVYVSTAFSQGEGMTWLKVGAKGKVAGNLSWDADFNARIGRSGLETFFPQVSLKYKVTKWFKPSLEYRFIIDKNKYGNYKVENRINVNAEFGEKIKRFEIGIRLRYQYSFDRINTGDYDSDFDQVFRLKPEIEYDINNSIFTPTFSTEFFYNPSYGPDGHQFNKIRFALGTKLELEGPHNVAVKYLVDKWLRQFDRGLRHVFSVSYSYKF